MKSALIIVALSLLSGLTPLSRGSGMGGQSVLLLSGPTIVQATDGILARSQAAADKVDIKDAWIQEGPPAQKITAGFMVIENHNSADISLLSASANVAEAVELHKMEIEDGMMKMRKVDSLNIPAGGNVELKPGGYHLMIIGLKRELKEGEKVEVTLRFSGAIQKTLTIPIKKRDSASKEGSPD